MTGAPSRPDAVDLELWTHRFAALALQMGERLARTAVSTNVKERLDFSCGLLDAAGELVVNAPHIPVHLGALGLCVRGLAQALPFAPGDVAVTNHPAFGGSHLPDVTVVTPVFGDPPSIGEPALLGYVASRAHHAEIGGIRPGSMPPFVRTLAEEGVVLPPFHLFRRGEARWEEVSERLLGGPHPTRALAENLADLRAAVAANHCGAEGLRSLAREHGEEAVARFMAAMTARAEERLRQALARFGRRDLAAEERLDDGSPLAVRLALRPDEEKAAVFDFTGSAGVHPGNLNAPPAVVQSAVLYTLRLVLGEPLPLNEGLLRPVEIRTPEGILNPPFPDDPARAPAVVGGNVETSQRLVDLLLKALGLAACSQGTMNNLLFGNESFGYYETICGGAGAGPGFAGASAVHTHMTNTRITDPEILEHRYPVRLHRFAIRHGSGGVGRFAGGDGAVREIEFLAPMSLSLLTQHRVEAPYGVEGGEPGQPGRQRLVRAGGEVEELAGIEAREVGPGDRLILETPGGGGWGERTSRTARTKAEPRRWASFGSFRSLLSFWSFPNATSSRVYNPAVPKIHLLSDPLVSQIAAGEVVERPASVVKELLENALDAGAREVAVELDSGGKARIALADDGHGMGRDDALLAFDRHATSKIASFADLERVGTLGFRGEALASIAAVARVELATAEEPGEGHRVRIEGGRVLFAEPVARPRGTVIEVRSLFWNVPARRKFLKEPATELRRCLEVVQGYALARPDVRFSVTHEGRVLLDALAAGAAGMRERIGQIFGVEFAGRLAEIPPLPSYAQRPGERIGGFLGTAETARTRRTFVYVNRRLLRDRSILATFYRAVREEWRSEDYPALFLFLDLPPEDVDVNVHPQKAEVRFRDPSLLTRLSDALRTGLAAARGEEPAPLSEPRFERPAPFAWQGLGEQPGERPEAAGSPGWGSTTPGFSGVSEPAPPPWVTTGSGGRIATPSYVPIERPIVPLSGRRGEARPFRLLGQYKGTLILLEGPDGLYLIDQHVAHERILYERLRRAMTQELPPVQHLLTPVLLDLGPAERLRLTELAPALETCGFAVAALSGNTLALTAVPAPVSSDEAEALLAALAVEDGEGTVEALRLRLLEALAASSACKAAVKMHHPLSAPEMEALVAELFQAEQPYACPHGRPIVLQMTDADLERRFGRRG